MTNTISTHAFAYLTSLANKHHHTPAKPIDQFNDTDGYAMIRDIYAPEITHTHGEYTTNNINHAMAAAIAEHDLHRDMYRAESNLAHRLGDTEMQDICARLASKETAAIDAIQRVATMAGLTDYPLHNIQAAMIGARREGESNWAYVGMTRWEQQQRDIVADLLD